MQGGELIWDMPSQTPPTGTGSDMGGCRLQTIFPALSTPVIRVFAETSPTTADSSSTSAVSEWGSPQWWLPPSDWCDLSNRECEAKRDSTSASSVVSSSSLGLRWAIPKHDGHSRCPSLGSIADWQNWQHCEAMMPPTKQVKTTTHPHWMRTAVSGKIQWNTMLCLAYLCPVAI